MIKISKYLNPNVGGRGLIAAAPVPAFIARLMDITAAF